MKFVLIIFIILGCGYIGYGFSLYFKKRKRFFSSFVNFIDSLMANINFSQNKLSQIFSNGELINEVYLKKLAKNYLEYLENKDITLNENQLFKNINIFSGEEKDSIGLLFSSLGKLDVENQLNILKAYKTTILPFEKNCEKELKKYGSMCVKLGFLLGSIIALILI